MQVKISNYNGCYFKIEFDDFFYTRDFQNEFSFEATNSKFLRRNPKYKNWDGKIRLYNTKTKLFPLGLMSKAFSYFKRKQLYVDNCFEFNYDYDKKITDTIIDNMVITLKDQDGNSQDVRFYDYQERAIHQSLKKKRRCFELATTAGKTLYSYGFFYLLKELGVEGNFVLLVPNLSLMHQAYEDFRIFSERDDKFSIDDVSLIFGDTDKSIRTKISIACYLSLDKVSKKELESVSAIIVDEAHQSSAKTFTNIFSKLVNTEYRIGISGTFTEINETGDSPNEMQIEGFIGQVDPDIKKTTKQLRDEGRASQITGKAYILRPSANDMKTYTEEKAYKDRDYILDMKNKREEQAYNIKKASQSGNNKLAKRLREEPITSEVSRFGYQDEIKYLLNLQSRNEFIVRCAINEPNNGIVGIKHVNSHGVILNDYFEQLCPKLGIDYFYLHGKSEKNANEVKEAVESSNNKVIVLGNLQMISKGWSVKNLNYGIIAHPMKTSKNFRQFVGRLLRIDKNKTESKIITIIDDLRNDTSGYPNYSFKHGTNNLETLIHQEIPFKTKRVFLK